MLTDEAIKLEIAALNHRLNMMTESRNFWRWGAVVMATALVISVGVAAKGGCW